MLLNSWIRCATDLHKLTLEHWEQDLLQNKSQWCSHFSAEHCPESCFFFFLFFFPRLLQGSLVFTAFPDDFPGWAENVNFLVWLTHESICWINPRVRRGTHSFTIKNQHVHSVGSYCPHKRARVNGWEVAGSFRGKSLLPRWICVRVLTCLLSWGHHLPRCRDLCSGI